jgi:hypothetical protein
VVVRQLQGRRRIGISWAGSPTQQDDAQRSMALQLLAPLFSIRDATWFSLQMPLSTTEAELLKQHGVVNLESDLAGYARTAALVDQLDLVISVDTAIAHVAGALGKPAWILLHHDPDWRWKPAGERSAWYPSARLFRQDRPGSWSEVVARVGAALQQFEP